MAQQATPPQDGTSAGIWHFGRHKLEWAAAAFLVCWLIRAGYQFTQIGYLPLPFWPDPQDVYADGYSTAWWAYNGRMYDIWKTVYPPLSFVITRALGTTRCYNADVTYVRDCDWGLWWWLLAFYVLNAILAFRIYRFNDLTTAVPRTVALMLGLPMLYAFEHLNLLVITYTGLFVAFGSVTRSVRLQWLGLAIAINLKIYLVVVLFGQLLKRRWRWVEGATLMTIGTAITAYAIIGHGTPVELYRNIEIFSTDPERSSSWYFVFYASSYVSMVEFFVSQFRLMPIVGSWRLEFFGFFLSALIRLVQAGTLASFVAVWLRPHAVTRTRIAAMCYLMVLISNETGGYTTAGAVFLVFFERWHGVGRIMALAAAYILCFAVDVKLVPIGTHVVQGYFAGRPVWQDMWVSIGPFLRPGLIMLMEVGLIFATFGDVRRAVREDRQDGDPRADGRGAARRLGWRDLLSSGMKARA